MCTQDAIFSPGEEITVVGSIILKLMRKLHLKTNFNCTIAIKSWSVTLNALGAACLKNRLIDPQSLVYFFKLISTYAYKCCTLC